MAGIEYWRDRASRVATQLVVGMVAAATVSLAAQASDQATVYTIDNASIVVRSTPIRVTDPTPDSPSQQSIEISSFPAPKQYGPICGAYFQGTEHAPCGDKPAKFESAARSDCPAGSFFDLGKWQCFTCPAGFHRGTADVETARACVKHEASTAANQVFVAASFKGPVCDAGSFHDPIRGGECWSCPAGSERTLAHVESSKACIDHGYAKSKRHSRATGLLKTDCPDGQFWDGVDGHCYSCPKNYKRTAAHVHSAKACKASATHKRATVVKKASCGPGEIKDLKVQGTQNAAFGGGCWTCPEAYDRTVFAIDSNKACETTPSLTFARAEKVADLTCPAGQHFDFIGLSQGDINNLKLSGQQPIESGTCWSCPEGYRRTTAHVKSGQACRAKTIGWVSEPFPNPGLFGLEGAAEVLRLLLEYEPEFVAKALNKVAASAALTSAKTEQQILVQEQSLLVNAPERSVTASGVVFAHMIRTLALPRDKRAVPEQQLIDSFARFVRGRREWIAKDAQAAYNVWVETDRHNRSKSNHLHTLFDYGTVPPDFQSIAIANALALGALDMGLGVAAGSLPLVGDILSLAIASTGGFTEFGSGESAARWVGKTTAEFAVGQAVNAALAKFSEAAALQLARNAIGPAKLALMGQTAANEAVQKAATQTLASAVGVGPQIVVASAMLVAQIALEQSIAINDAPGKLATAVATAQQVPDMERLAQTPEGVAELMGQWTFAVSKATAPTAGYLAGHKTLAAKAMTGSSTGVSSSVAKQSVDWQ